MSTRYKSVEAKNEADQPVSMTQYCGPVLENENKSRLRLQLTQGDMWVNLSREQAASLAGALAEWLADDRETDY